MGLLDLIEELKCKHDYKLISEHNQTNYFTGQTRIKKNI
jgi:hypothetical protein